MFEVILLIIGAVAGFFLYKMVIMSGSRQSTINNKINTFDSITESWTEIRHFILANHKGKLLSREANHAIDEIHKNSQQLIDNLTLTCENQHLISDINSFNESIYQNEWDTMDIKKLSAITDQLKTDSSTLARRMREDINNSYQLEWQDLISCITGLCSNGTCNETPAQTDNKSSNSATSSSATSNAEYKDDWIEVLLKSKFNFLKDWDIRSLSRKKTPVTEEPQAKTKQDEEVLSSPESKPKKAEPAVETKPKKAEPAVETKPKKTESSVESKPGKEKTSPENNSKK